MTVPAILTLRARRELAKALERVAEDNPDSAERLYDAVRDVARLIGANPAIGARRPRLASPRYRFWSILQYQYLLAYTDATDPPRIVRFVHTKRDLPRVLAELRD
ncbi:MAG: type II toxin-antitoxin system RelE/ParE family toxin [Stellaceae bacterium]